MTETMKREHGSPIGLRFPPWLGTVLLALLVLRVVLAAWSHRTAAISADPYSYLDFARNLAGGHFFANNEVSRAVQALWQGDELTEGPVWNTHVRGDGRMMYTVGVGLPLFLAGVFKALGWFGAVYVNHLLLAMVLWLFVICLRQGWNASPHRDALAALAILALLYSAPPIYLQFTQPWREPLFYTCVLGGVVALLRFLRTGRTAWVGLMAWVIGYACCIKEANVIYVAWLGIYLLCSAGFRAHPHKVRVLATAAVCGLLGLAPILLQNLVSTGNPFLSLQFAHSASNYVSPHAPGLTAGNLFTIFTWYVELYYEEGGVLFWVPALVLAVVGARQALRCTAGRILLGLGGVHAFLYCQWGNSEFRHMYFAHLPYAAFLALGTLAMVEALARRFPRLPSRDTLFAMVLAAAAFCPLPWGDPPAPADRYDVADARRLGETLSQIAPGRSLFLSNRKLRDVVGTLADVEVVRPSELTWFDPELGVEQAVDWYLSQGVNLFFLDNVDLDPRWAGLVDRTRADAERLRERYDLKEVMAVPAGPYNLGRFLARQADALRVFRILPWSAQRVERALPVPEEGAAFLWVHPRSLGSRLKVRLDGRDVPDAAGHYLRPLPVETSGETLTVVAEAGGANLPALEDLRLVGWDAVLAIDFGYDAAPRDEPFFAAPLGEQPQRRERHVVSPATLRLPVREGAEFFTVAGLGVKPLEEPASNAVLHVEVRPGAAGDVAIENDAAWFPIVEGRTETRWAGITPVHLSAGQGGKLGLRRVRLHTAHRVVRHRPAESALAAGVWGLLAPAAATMEAAEWTARLSGGASRNGRCLANPQRSTNRFAWLFETVAGEAMEIRFEGAGLLQPRWIEVSDRIDLDMGPDDAVFLAEGFHPVESGADGAFRWTSGRNVVRVPVAEGARSFRLVLDLRDGRPSELAERGARTLQCRVAGAEAAAVLPRERGTLEMKLDLPASPEGRLADLALESATWIPAEHLPTGDARELGFRCYGLRWEPIQ